VAERADPPMDAMIRWRVVLYAAKLPVASVGEAATRCFAFIEALLCHHRLTPPCGPGGVRSRAKHAVKPKNQAAVEIGSQVPRSASPAGSAIVAPLDLPHPLNSDA
jgi:hypothetical protein